MPYFEVQTSTCLKKETQDALYHELGRIMELVPGKSEQWVMVHLEENAKMCFSGNSQAPAAAIVVKTFHELEEQYYDLLTAELCKSAAQLLGVDSKRIYVIYEPISHWGWDSGNF